MELTSLRTPRVVRPLVTILVPALLGSCSSSIPHMPKVRVTDPAAADELNAYSVWGEKVDFKDNTFRASSKDAYYTVERKKKGYLTDYHVMTQEGINPMIGLDVLALSIGLGMAVSGGGSNKDGMAPEEEIGPQMVKIWGILIAAMGGLGLVFGKKKSFKGAMELGPMTPLPKHVPGGMRLYVDNISVNLGSGSVDTRNFKSIPNYKSKLKASGEVVERKKVSESFSVKSIENIDASVELNKVLAEIGYVDTTSSMSRLGAGTNMLHGEVVKWGYNRIYGGGRFVGGSAYTFEVTTKWEIKDNVSKETILERSITATSDIIVNHADNGLFRKGFINSLTKGMVKLMEDREFTDAMVDKRQKFQATVDAWSPITINAGKYTTQKVGESSKSVATVKTKDGHGSGVFVSADGYLVTNLHVIGKQTEDIEVTTKDGAKLKGRVERGNPVYDLALLKVEGYKGKPVAIGMGRSIDLGETVYAVGTPTDLALGQTVTRGIISGKRTFGEVDFIQTDVSINRGNSGGALLSDSGQLVGIVNAKIIGTGVEGVGFAIPAYYLEEALKVVIR